MTNDELKDKITQLVARETLTTSFEMLELKISRHSRRLMISILMDKKDGSINLDECADWNRKLSEKIETEDWVPAAYVVEVSSPGLDRALANATDFSLAIDARLGIHYRDENDVAQQGEYILKSLEGESLTLENQKDNSEIKVNVDQILSAKKVVKFKKAKK